MEMARPSMFRRALHGSAVTAGAYAASQLLRLGANLILTRLLFPEAFGLMALVSVCLVGLAMFSDVGLGPAIARSPHGDEPEFLDTAWTLQAFRGLMLCLGTVALAWPAAYFYDAPELQGLLPVAGLGMLIGGLFPTRIETATRHLLFGRVTALDLVSQVIGTAAMVALAFAMGSVWALVIGTTIGTLSKLVLMHYGLPGHRNRFRWDAKAGKELIHFGKWIFLSTACGFVLSQGDKAILGAFLPLDALGVYNIGYFLASFPMLLGGAITGRVLIPLYRDHHPSASAANFRKLRRLRLGLQGGIMAMLAIGAVFGPVVVEVLYDSRYAMAQAVVVAVVLVQLPQVIGMTYDQSALAAGDSRTFFVVMAVRAGVQTLAFLIGVSQAGLMGALLAQFLSSAFMHLLVIWMARRNRAWDGALDAGFALAGLAIVALALGLHGDLLQAL